MSDEFLNQLKPYPSMKLSHPTSLRSALKQFLLASVAMIFGRRLFAAPEKAPPEPVTDIFNNSNESLREWRELNVRLSREQLRNLYGNFDETLPYMKNRVAEFDRHLNKMVVRDHLVANPFQRP